MASLSTFRGKVSVRDAYEFRLCGLPVQPPLALLPGLTAGVPVGAAAAGLLKPVQQRVDLRVMVRAHLHRPAERILWVDVVAVNPAGAGRGCVTEEALDNAPGAGQAPPRGSVVHVAHAYSPQGTLQTVGDVMTGHAKPTAVFRGVITTLRTERNVVNVDAGS